VFNFRLQVLRKFAHGNPCYGGAIAGARVDATKRAEQTSSTTYVLANTERRALGEILKPWWAVVKALALQGRDRRGKEASLELLCNPAAEDKRMSCRRRIFEYRNGNDEGHTLYVISVQRQFLRPNHLCERLLNAHRGTLGRRIPTRVLIGAIVRRFPAEKGALLYKI
jgi:hypothetical protein